MSREDKELLAIDIFVKHLGDDALYFGRKTDFTNAMIEYGETVKNKDYDNLLYQVKENISYLHEKSAEYDASQHDDESIKATFQGKAFAYKWAANKLTKSLEWLGIIQAANQ